jgi:hypothetical protein
MWARITIRQSTADEVNTGLRTLNAEDRTSWLARICLVPVTVRILRIIAVMVCILQGIHATAQKVPLPQPDEARKPTLSHLYWHLLMYQNHLDRVAAKHETQGKDGTWLRTYIQKKLGFTDEQFGPIRTSAQRLGGTLSQISSKVQTIVATDRAQRASNASSSNGAAASRSKLQDLNQEREDAITREISALNEALGAERSAKLKDFLQNQFSVNVTIVPRPPLPPHWRKYGNGSPALEETNR